VLARKDYIERRARNTKYLAILGTFLCLSSLKNDKLFEEPRRSTHSVLKMAPATGASPALWSENIPYGWVAPMSFYGNNHEKTHSHNFLRSLLDDCIQRQNMRA
jgi:hypothetical protein